jgi:hypothetical protein
MFNPYTIILGTVIVGGLAITVWGWIIMTKAKKMQSWPTTKGIIKESRPEAEYNDLLPHIAFSYQVANNQYNTTFMFPEGTHPSQQFSQAYLDKYPVGTEVTVYFNPDHPETATLEPETKGDWMILALGVMMVIGGIITFLV